MLAKDETADLPQIGECAMWRPQRHPCGRSTQLFLSGGGFGPFNLVLKLEISPPFRLRQAHNAMVTHSWPRLDHNEPAVSEALAIEKRS